MTCHYCEPFCVTSEKQLANRLCNIDRAPAVKVYACKACEGTDWVTTRTFILDDGHLPWWKIMLAKLIGQRRRIP